MYLQYLVTRPRWIPSLPLRRSTESSRHVRPAKFIAHRTSFNITTYLGRHVKYAVGLTAQPWSGMHARKMIRQATQICSVDD
jgi:hypothetical protein